MIQREARSKIITINAEVLAVYKNFVKVLLFSCLLVGISACQSVSVEPTVAPVDDTNFTTEAELPDIGKIVVGHAPIIAGAPVYVALEKGYFAEQGLEIELQTFRGAAAMLAPLSTGQVDVGVSSLSTASLNAFQKDINIQIVAGIEGANSLALVVRKNLADNGEVSTVADLAGRKLATNAIKSLSEYTLYNTLKKGNLTLDDIELVTMPFPDIILALENEAIEAALLPHPFVGRAIDEEIGVVVAGGGDTRQVFELFFGQRLLEPANREVGVRFLMAYLKGARDLQNEGWKTEENAAIINKHTEIPIPTIQKVPEYYLDMNGDLNLASLEEQMLYYVGQGYTSFSEPIPVEEFVDTSFLEEALERVGKFEE
ncbi:MAG: ABC transporter substrate-binding protein [Chloroflexota bacterium]|nr:ABC transporter substrate-binding protein [Chloroflexota bacterium]